MYKILLLFLLTSCINNRIDISKWNLYNNHQFDFRFRYPLDWKITSGTFVETIYVEEAQVKESANNRVSIKTNFYVTVSEISNNDLEVIGDNYEKITLNTEVFDDNVIESRTNITFLGNDAIEFIGTCTFIGQKAKWKLIMFLYDGYYYELCTTSQQDRYSQMLPIVDNIFDSFELN